jgi:hypothetical protein
VTQRSLPRACQVSSLGGDPIMQGYVVSAFSFGR